MSVFVIGRAQKPELVVQTGTIGDLTSIAFSPDGKTLASASWDVNADPPVKLWDVATGTELRVLDGSFNHTSVAFSPKGRILASGGSDGSVRLSDIATGREVRTLAADGPVAFSPDGKILASGSATSTVKFWAVATGRQVRTLQGHPFQISFIAFSPDGKTFASSSNDYSGNPMIKLWELTTGRELRTLKGVGSVVFSPDRKTLAGGDDSGVRIWDIATGRELHTFKADGAAAFSPDGKTLATISADSNIKLWEVATGRELHTFKGVGPVAFSPDGKTLAIGAKDASEYAVDAKIKLLEVATGRELRTLKEQPPNHVESVAFSPDGKTFASATQGDMVKLRNVLTGAERTLEGHSDSYLGLATPTSIAFSPDGKMLATGDSDHAITIWDVTSGAQLRTLEARSRTAEDDSCDEQGVTAIAFSPDGKTLATGDDYTVALWDVATGAELHAFKKHCDDIIRVAFSPDGKILASSGGGGTVNLWDVVTGAKLRTLKGRPAEFNSLAFSPNGRFLASGGEDVLELWNVATGVKLRTLESAGAPVFSPNGRILAVAAVDGIELWDVATGRLLQTLLITDHSSGIESMVFGTNGKYLLSLSLDGFKVWDTRSGKELASFVALDEHDWIVVTPDGLFDGSPAAWNNIIWRFNNNTFDYRPVEAYFSDFYYPGLLNDIFVGKRPRAPSDISQKDRRQPQLKLSLADAPPDTVFTARNVSVKIALSQALAGAQDVRLFRNGSLVKVWRGDVLKGQSSATLDATIPIVAGENRLTAYAFNHDNIKSSDATIVINGADSLKRPGTAYILAVGVNSYSNPQYNLKYAVADAEDFAMEFERQQKSLNNYEQVTVIPLYDKETTKANILQALTQLANKAQPEDAVIVYFSGHGTAQEQRFYLIPYDLGYQGSRTQLSAADLRTILSHSISDRELEEVFEKIDAGQLLTIIDACNSGQALDAEEKRRGPMNSKGLAQLAYEKGMYILTAAQSYQAAWEAARLGHGFLTYALVEEGLKKGTADREPKDNQIVLREWLDYATERVPQMQEEKLKETPTVKDRQGRELEFVFVEGDENVKDPEKRSVQRPRVFYRRESESSPLIIARPQSAPPRN
ncbi:MAG TPA: caspase family protein [Pyrinomonadaceae bacterium]